MDPLYRLPTSPVANPAAVLAGDRWRITVLTDGLLRLEHLAEASEDGAFEDRASSFAIHRDLPVPSFEVVQRPDVLEVVTDRLRLTYDRRPFSPSGLTVAVRGDVSDWHAVWRFGAPPMGGAAGNLGGTARTLDEVDGATPLEPGVASRDGWALIDDSTSFLIEDDGAMVPRPAGGHDLYVFAYGLDHAQAVRALYALSGPQPVLPRWALGTWWSRYHPYTADGYLELLDSFAAEGVPLSVGVLDMDWHLVDVDPAQGSGWTGYTWNRDLVPDPPALLAAVHERGLRVTLNDHPADGVRSHEDAYPAVAAAMGREPDGSPIAFDLTDPAFRAAWFDVLHRGLEDDGVDFWWTDWQQGPYSRVAGLDPLWLLNHLHFLDAARGGRRPIVFSRYAGPGSHRYPVGFSGDSVATWASLDFQAEFTATAANIGYGWWSHDVGGHLGGARDDELAARWVQLGVLSPIMRLHSTTSPFMSKEPWTYGPVARSAMVETLRLRHRLVPYLHTMNHRAAHDGVPLVVPMYHLHPRAPQAYAARTQYAFGSELVVAPITTRADPGTLTGSVTAWLPPGTWVDVFSHLVYDGDRELVVHRALDAVPVLARAGAVVPLDAAAVPGNDPVNPHALEVLLVVGADGAFTLVEDDGVGDGREPQRWARTPIAYDQGAGTLTIGPARGATACLPPARTWRVTTVAHAAGEISVGVDGASVEPDVQRAPRRTTVTVPDVPVGATVVVRLGADPALAANDVDERVVDLLMSAQVPYDLKQAVLDAVVGDAPLTVRLSRLLALDVGRPLETAVGELLLARP